MLRKIRNTLLFAFVQGFIENLDGCGGRTHPTNADWNEAYDRGMNFADFVTGNREPA
ncbi:hypothetical protein [Erythrobacter aureus]|uniref:hypothetical protein n=1 Tax=Erythrobacter aureus TaxID=2182384 RepID=UPI0013B39A9C|nr:hypothetical protein [Erythrobacter aureus]